MTGQIHFHESLAETALSELLFTIYRHKVPGRLELRREAVVKRIYVSGGAVVHATSSDRADRLGAHLYRLGKLSREQLVDTMKRREASGKLHGEILIEDGLVSPAELYEAIRSQMEAIVWSCFAWTEGEVEFRIGDSEDPLLIKIHLPMRQVIARGIKQVSDTKGLVSRLGKKTTTFRPSYTAEDLIEIALDANEYRLLRLVDGRRTLYDICNQGPYAVSENARLLYAYHVLHLIERNGEGDTGAVKIRLPTDGGRMADGDQRT